MVWSKALQMYKRKLQRVTEFTSVTVQTLQGGPKKTDTQFYFGDNFGNSAPILTILSLLQAEIYGA